MLNWAREDKKGATVVEFALIAPLLLLILFGIIEYGIIFMQVHLVENAAREGVRRGVVADTYNCWQGSDILNTKPEPPTCLVDRYWVVVETVQDYLKTFYPELTDIPGSANFVSVERETAGNLKWLIVSVEVENFMPRLVSALLGDRFDLEKISYSARGEYENSDEP